VENLHQLLLRQIRRSLEDPNALSDDERVLLGLVSDAYEQFDDDRAIMERSLELMSKELLDANSDLRATFE
jgi:hypothetical protein